MAHDMSASLRESPSETETVLFRPSKRRKVYRQRAGEAEGPSSENVTTLQPASSAAAPSPVRSPEGDGGETTDDVEGTRVSVAEILRLRKLRKQRVGGVEFRAAPSATVPADSAALMVPDDGGPGHPDEAEVQVAAVRRFAKQTGIVGDVDKHMMAYVESKLAKRQPASPPVTNSTAHIFDSQTKSEDRTTDPNMTKSSKDGERQPAALGKIQEIDLGSEARARNAARTEQARKKLAGEDVEDEDEAGAPKNKKVRLGRDGKPWRGKKRRTSDDVKRDALVEEVLRENRIEMYEEPSSQSLGAGLGDGENDDRIAEAFRREFLDAISARHRRRHTAAPPARKPGGKKAEEESRGPKLGGSRSARAAMREMQLKAGKK
ncbi:MAG: hypothetical protein M1818_003411 [Claussenomyces sp. TS43310]|nr:MAG: hypothetical protein M1818_003411 [Claussenomyces sp. TS43310]